MSAGERTAVYRFFDATGNLLYVGITEDLMTRWRWHQKHADWWNDQSRIEVVWHNTRASADAEETQAVRTEGAKRNVQKRGKTPLRSIRIPTELWQEFGAVCFEMGMTRTDVLRALIEWFVGTPGAKCPTRPTEDQLRAARERVDRAAPAQ